MVLLSYHFNLILVPLNDILIFLFDSIYLNFPGIEQCLERLNHMVDSKVYLVRRVPQIMDHHVKVDPRVLNLQLELIKLLFVVVNSYLCFLLLPTLS